MAVSLLLSQIVVEQRCYFFHNFVLDIVKYQLYNFYKKCTLKINNYPIYVSSEINFYMNNKGLCFVTSNTMNKLNVAIQRALLHIKTP